jgi:glycosyltransferase involved in cell wall biosynthesis
MVGIEAMQHGRPVVAFESGGIPDWLDHEKTGLLVREQDSQALTRAITRLLSDTRYASYLGSNAHKRAAALFSFSNYIDGLESTLAGVFLEKKVLAN